MNRPELLKLNFAINVFIQQIKAQRWLQLIEHLLQHANV